MDNFQIETAHNISITQNVASLLERILAFLLDALVLVFYVIVMSFIMSGLELSGMEEWVYYLILGLPPFLYFLMWESLWDGRTPGKAALDIRVVKLDGSKPSFSNYLVRWLLRFVDITLTSGSVAVVSILLNGKGQRLGDIAAGTTVISERNTTETLEQLTTYISEDYHPNYAQVNILTDRDLQDIKEIFNEALKNGNKEVVIKLAEKVSDLIEVTPKQDPEDFIRTVIKDYNYYTQQ